MKKELKETVECSRDPIVVATGGLATLIDKGAACIDYVDKMLTLEGLEIIYEKNKKEKRKKCTNVK